ncbi:CHY zinc finger protein [Halovivax gelatinilyticus]|uniref:CHY zinc finger protein n=1 Tax=Halovivax gelatinilyticus TaxID=2961597 RepID=UPI0020CA2F34|nr:CHY zinc finger protein [Halovivax gelatinilyticus]
MRLVHGVRVRGVDVDDETRCRHYDGPSDVVAMRFGCCESFYPCHRCHDERTDHDGQPWPRDRFDEPAVLFGVCGSTLTPPAYFDADHRCPDCGVEFNPGCAAHRSIYFEES